MALTAATFSGSALTPEFSMICPRNLIFLLELVIADKEELVRAVGFAL